jgi:molecular chaperone GrpE
MSADRTDEADAAASAAGVTEADAAQVGAVGRIAELEAEVAELKDRLLRALAEQENFRRRAHRDRAEAVKFAASGFARDLLPTADNLRRAIESVPESAVVDETLRRLVAGVAATERGLLEALEKHHIHRIEPLGEAFEPDRHQAVFEVPEAESPAGTVVAMIQPGYLQHGRLLRPAMVGVAKESDAASAVASDDNVRGSSEGEETT